jgi:hypothetical protein
MELRINVSNLSLVDRELAWTKIKRLAKKHKLDTCFSMKEVIIIGEILAFGDIGIILCVLDCRGEFLPAAPGCWEFTVA